MIKRVELHNHTNESDGKLSIYELADYFTENEITAFALSDHNTTSGIAPLREYKKDKFELIESCELTTYYGHIVVHNIKENIPWDDINTENVDVLFDRAHAQNAIAGIAHPFCPAKPLGNGIRFELKVNDYKKVDFIEVVNMCCSYELVNSKAFALWEDLVIEGYRISPTSGLDLHVKAEVSNIYKTYLMLDDTFKNKDIATQLDFAIKNGLVLVTREPIIEINDSKVSVTNFDKYKERECYVTVVTKNGVKKLTDYKFDINLGEATVIKVHDKNDKIIACRAVFRK
ncbi:MAG: hypothetical protein BEN19_06040 [Epulopiscium sp. Nuni2H_MBin003]|nr:MAG: hypothetical protein BEN19_06040 [Epulopiscium sp. Nuni2H_MBin003]